jgi:hypothetical protein
VYKNVITAQAFYISPDSIDRSCRRGFFEGLAWGVDTEEAVCILWVEEFVHRVCMEPCGSGISVAEASGSFGTSVSTGVLVAEGIPSGNAAQKSLLLFRTGGVGGVAVLFWGVITRCSWAAVATAPSVESAAAAAAAVDALV